MLFRSGGATDLLVSGAVDEKELPAATLVEHKFEFTDNALRDLWVAVQWAKQ